MAADHGAIHYGRDTIWGEDNEVIRWKLQGEGLTTYEPTWEGDLHLVSGADDLVFHVSVIAMGKTRALTLHSATHAHIGGVGGTALVSTTNIPAEHRPSHNLSQVGYLQEATIIPAVLSVTTGGQLQLWTTRSQEWPNAPPSNIFRIHAYEWSNGDTVGTGQITLVYLVA